jgi:predicted lipid-binding transport protein (Tim44 family)
MKTTRILSLIVLVLGLAAFDGEAAKRFGGGSNLGKQRATPTQRDATSAPASTPAQPAAPAQPASAPGAAGAGAIQPKPSFMQRWGGMIGGLAIGALLASMFGAQMGPIVGMLLMGLLGVGVVMLLMKLFAGRREPTPAMAPAQARTGFSGIGSAIPGESSAAASASAMSAPTPVTTPALAPGEVEPFLRVAKTSFIRLQAANDAGDLDDIRDYTTPEVYAEIAMQLKERQGAAQKTEVVSVNASLVESVVENDYAIASVRFTGLIREDDAANPEPFDEIWHVKKSLRERNGSWMIAGIQQVA